MTCFLLGGSCRNLGEGSTTVQHRFVGQPDKIFMPASLKGREHIFQHIKAKNNRQGRILLILIFT